MTKWIDIKLELPPLNEKVLITRHGLHDIARRESSDQYYSFSSHRLIYSTYMTHWMPLPELPS